MSEEMAQRKADELKTLAEQEAQFKEDAKHDVCPGCGTPTIKFPWITHELMLAYGATDCPNCGTLFVPLSIRKLKFENLNKLVKPASGIIVE